MDPPVDRGLYHAGQCDDRICTLPLGLSRKGNTVDLVYYLLPMALALGAFFLAGFLFAAWRGQFDDLDTPAHRMLIDDGRLETVEEKRNERH